MANDFIRDTKINRLRQAVNGNHLAVKVAVPNDEEISGIFTERVGIFTDKAGDVVAFTGTSSHTFDMQNQDFESVDVFTSWNDPSRTKTKIADQTFGRIKQKILKCTIMQKLNEKTF